MCRQNCTLMHKAHRKWKNSRMQGVMAFNSYIVNYKYTTFHFHEIGIVRFNGDHRLVVGNTNGTIECRQSGKRMHRQPERLSTGRDCCCPDREDVVFLQISARKAGRITDMSVRYPFFFFFPAFRHAACVPAVFRPIANSISPHVVHGRGNARILKASFRQYNTK